MGDISTNSGLIVYADEWVVVANKPQGITTSPDPNKEKGSSLVELVQQEYPGYAACHQLDYETSGMVVGGLDRKTRKNFFSQFLLRQIQKWYVAATEHPLPERGKITAPLKYIKLGNTSIVDYNEGKPSITEFQKLGDSEGLAYALVRLHTGRTHQIRAHFQHIGAPLYGDRKYNGTTGNGQYLHAACIAFSHPKTGEQMAFAALPCWMPESLSYYVKEALMHSVNLPLQFNSTTHTQPFST